MLLITFLFNERYPKDVFMKKKAIFLETGAHYGAQSGFELMIFLHLPTLSERIATANHCA
jgi:hypothetical protein